MHVPHVVHVHVTVTWDCFINKTNSRCSHLSLSACTLLHCAARYGSAHWKALEHPADGVTQTHSQQLLQEREPFYVQITAVIRLIVINRIQNKSFCLHIISVFTVYIYYVYKYKHMHVYILNKNMYIYIYINIHSTHTYIVKTNVFILDAINHLTSLDQMKGVLKNEYLFLKLQKLLVTWLLLKGYPCLWANIMPSDAWKP